MEIFSRISRVSSVPLVSRRLLVRSSCRSAFSDLAAEQVVQALQALVGENADFIGEVLFELRDVSGLDGLVALVLLRTLTAEDLYVDDGAFDARRAVERSVANVTGLFAEISRAEASLPA